ncbi:MULTISPECIES: hypothetical protein [unclassified Streptomyces]|uniref:hypothetical protein n=1 Tax=unclassified Streptomyces TaxID=2593676 RepID=UPI00093F3C77|nr:hypothetical protein [Streptomyces sp. CB02058]OKI85901.1 hypothetical protein AMK10_35505 [Streptomyces sp. CB02058]
MDLEALAALATAGGAALVSAAGTDLWEAVRSRIARLTSRGDGEAERVTLQRLDRTAAELESNDTDSDGVVRSRGRLQNEWTVRLSDALDAADGPERNELADYLRELAAAVAQLGPAAAGGTATAGDGGFAAAGDVTIRAEHGGYAAGVQNFGDAPANPTQPGQSGP